MALAGRVTQEVPDEGGQKALSMWWLAPGADELACETDMKREENGLVKQRATREIENPGQEPGIYRRFLPLPLPTRLADGLELKDVPSPQASAPQKKVPPFPCGIRRTILYGASLYEFRPGVKPK